MSDQTPKLQIVTNEEDAASELSRIVKRDGTQVIFNSEKIMSAIKRAGEATGEFDGEEADLLTTQVTKVLRHRFTNGNLPTIEQIQDVVEQVLISANYYKTARAYIVYRESRSQSRQVGERRRRFQRKV